MNRREAYEYLKDYLDSAFHYSNGYETYCYLRDCADTLAPNTPDPETGLMKCGCGGKPTFLYSYVARDDECCLECPRCEAKSALRLGEERARDSWNTAMGWRAEE